MKANFIKFLVSKTFFKNLGLALLITLLLIVAIQVGLRIYTEHGKEITVPDFSGMPLKQVDQLCFQNNLLWLVQDSVYIKDSAGGIIMDQYPLPGSRVKRNRKIFLTTNAWFPESVKMPKAYDMPFRQAERVLQSAGLVIDSIDYQPYFAYKYVREQRFNGEIIPAGTPIPKGSGITLVVGQGLSNERSPVPNLLSLTKDSAQATALKNYFNLGAIVYDYSVTNADDSATSRVYRQFPDYYGQSARLGTAIDIWLTVDSLILKEIDSILLWKDSVLTADTLQIEPIK